MMEASVTCDIARLPEELLSAALSLTTPRDACRAAAASRDFRAAADSDAVWSRFLPRDLPPLADAGGCALPSSEKGRFLRLCDCPLLLADGLTSMWLDRESGARCYMLSAMQLNIAWGDTPHYWSWIPIKGPSDSFSEAARLLHVCWLDIRGKIDSKMLSKNSAYAAYIVFKVDRGAFGLGDPYQETLVSLGGNESTRRVCLAGYASDGEDVFPHLGPCRRRRSRLEIPQNVLLPRGRADGWKELELGEFCNDDGEDGEVSISLKETSATLKVGIIVQGIEIRPKKQNGY